MYVIFPAYLNPKMFTSGVARISPLLGHSMGTLRSYKLPREVQKLIRVLGASSPHPRILQPPRSVLRPCTVAKCKSLTAKLAYDECIRLDRNSVFDFKTI